MKKNAFFLIAALIVSGFFSCNTNPYFTVRSGNIYNDDVAEPLSGKAEQFEYNLNFTNEALENFKNRKFKVVYDRYFSNEIRKRVSYESFSKSWGKIFREFGRIRSYKPMQWHFVTMNQDNRDVLCSIKIVHHEKQSFNYVFIFDNNDRKHLLNFTVKLRKQKQEKGSI